MEKRLPLDELEPGMTVAESVSTRSGRTLLTSGSEISEGVIKALNRAKVENVLVDVPGEEDTEDEQEDSEPDQTTEEPEESEETEASTEGSEPEVEQSATESNGSVEDPQTIGQQLDHMFEPVEDDERMQQIKEIALNFHKSKLG